MVIILVEELATNMQATVKRRVAEQEKLDLHMASVSVSQQVSPSNQVPLNFAEASVPELQTLSTQLATVVVIPSML